MTHFRGFQNPSYELEPCKENLLDIGYLQTGYNYNKIIRFDGESYGQIKCTKWVFHFCPASEQNLHQIQLLTHWSITQAEH